MALDAHGGIERWNTFSWVCATIVSGGQLWAMKRVPQDPEPREMKVATKYQWASVAPYGAPDQHTEFTAERVAIERNDGTVVSERLRPAQHTESKPVEAPWDALDRAYSNGYAEFAVLTPRPDLFDQKSRHHKQKRCHQVRPKGTRRHVADKAPRF